MHKYFAVVPNNKIIGNIALVCKRFYAFVIAKELGSSNNSSTDTYKKINTLYAEDIIDKKSKRSVIKFGIGNIPIENKRLRSVYWMPKI